MEQKKYIWKRMWARKFTPFIPSAFMYVLLEREGLNLAKNKLFMPEGNLYAIYFEEGELNQIIENYTAMLQEQDMEKYADWYEGEYKKFLTWSQQATKQDFSQSNSESLADTVKTLFTKLIYFAELQFYPFMILEGPTKAIEKTLAREPHILQAIATPYKHTEIAKGRIALLKLIIGGKTDEKSLEKYVKKYAWLPIYDFTDKPLTRQDVQSQIAQAPDAAKELANLTSHQKKGLLEYQKFFKTIKDKDFKKLVEIVHYFSYLKEMRDDYRRHAYYLWFPFWQEVGKRLSLTAEEATCLIEPELIAALNEGKDFRDLAKRRSKRYALWFKEGKLKVYAGDETKEVEQLITPLKTSSEITGFAASKGKVTGRVNVIYHQGEFAKFKDGDILVTTMTHPEFLLIMKKSAAIVTDEGGITSHAAIVARELGVPCIIGTKIATKVLKDGELVEVDANKGIVRKI